MPSVVRKTLRDSRRAVLGWAVGISAFILIYVSFYSQVKSNPSQFNQDTLPQGMRDFFGVADMTTAVGYLQATVFSLLGPLLLIMFATILGTRGIAGPEGAGVLDLLLANPIGRRRFALERFTALGGAMVLVGLLPWLLILLLNAGEDMGVGVGNISAAALGLLLLGLFFGTLAFTVGAATGSRSAALAVTGVVAVAGYLLQALGNLVDGLRPLRWVSPFQYYEGGEPLVNGFQAGYPLVLIALTVALVAVALLTFERRDLKV